MFAAIAEVKPVNKHPQIQPKLNCLHNLTVSSFPVSNSYKRFVLATFPCQGYVVVAAMITLAVENSVTRLNGLRR